MVEKCHGEMDVSEFNAVRSIVRRTRRKSAHLRAMEEDDLLQDCMLHWLRVRGGLDLATVRNPGAFLRRVLENKLRDLARNAHTEKRGLALQVPSKSFDSEHRSPNFMVRDALESPGWEWEFDQPAAAIDLARAIGELSGLQRQLCQLLMSEGLSKPESAERLGVPRVRVHRELLRIRRTFLDRGLEKYLRRD